MSIEQSSTNENNSKNNTPLTLIGNSGDKEGTKSFQNTEMSWDKPWFNSDGTLKTDQEISAICKNWSATTWDQYLETVVGKVDLNESEVAFPFMDTQTISDANELLIFLRSIEEYEFLHEYLELALKRLSKRERETLRLIYYKKLSHKEVAQELQLEVSSIVTYRKRGIKKLKQLLSSNEFLQLAKRFKLLKANTLQ